MRLDLGRVRTVARREYLTTVRRKAFLLTAIGTPAYFALVMFLSIGPQLKDRTETLRKFTALGVVDSSGLYQGADSEIVTVYRADENPFGKGADERFKTRVERFDDLATAQAALRDGRITQLLVIPEDYLASGRLSRYARKTSLGSSIDRRPISTWLASQLVAQDVDASRAARVGRPMENENLYSLTSKGTFERIDDRRELVDLMLPMVFGLLLGVCIVSGGQYLLQGVSEEKESRILEAVMCMVTPEELLAGKLLGLGAAGLTLVGVWIALGTPFVTSAAAAVQITIPLTLLLTALAYFVLGYLFFGSIMTGIGAVTGSMREAQQFSVWLAFATFVPFIMMAIFLEHPGSPLPVALSMFPPTAPTAMMLRLTAPGSHVPLWQIGLSLALLAVASYYAVMLAARIFRVGLLMYGKTPNLPEILRWARRA